MSKTILVTLSVIVLGAAVFAGVSLNKNKEITPCSKICSNSNSICPSLIDKNTCESKCDSLSEETKKHLEDSSSCQELTEKPELIADLIIPEIETPENIDSSDDCELACSNYTVKCLTLVPGASQSLYNEGLMSCINECKKWDNNKIGCIMSAIDCPAMTNVCGL